MLVSHGRDAEIPFCKVERFPHSILILIRIERDCFGSSAVVGRKEGGSLFQGMRDFGHVLLRPVFRYATCTVPGALVRISAWRAIDCSSGSCTFRLHDMAPVSQRKHLGRDKFGAQFSLPKTQQYTDPVTRTAIPTMYVPVVCKQMHSSLSCCHESRFHNTTAEHSSFPLSQSRQR